MKVLIDNILFFGTFATTKYQKAKYHEISKLFFRYMAFVTLSFYPCDINETTLNKGESQAFQSITKVTSSKTLYHSETKKKMEI